MLQCNYLPEGAGMIVQAENAVATLERAALSGEILQAVASSCTCCRDLLVDIGGQKGIIARNDADLGVQENKTRDIAIISRVGKPVCFIVLGRGGDGVWRLSRAEAQRRTLDRHMENTSVGDIICGRITHLESFGAFVDIGCGVVSFIGVENISVSRISHPRQRFMPGQMIYAAVLEKDIQARRITLTHRELLGTWEQNAEQTAQGSTVLGVVRSVKDYGAFVELLPNLSGLTESREGLAAGNGVSVYIKSITPDCMKIKLVVIDMLERAPSGLITPEHYYIKSGRLERWRYSPETCRKTVERIFAPVD